MTMHSPIPPVTPLIAQLRPFLRYGRPRALTAGDYATLDGRRRDVVTPVLYRLQRQGYLDVTLDALTRTNIYQLTDAGLECLDGNSVPGLTQTLMEAQVAVLAKRAFLPPPREGSDRPDHTLLLPAFEEEIGKLMRRSVPADLRPRGDCLARYAALRTERDAQVAKVRDMLTEGATQREVMERLGVSEGTARQYIAAAKAKA